MIRSASLIAFGFGVSAGCACNNASLHAGLSDDQLGALVSERLSDIADPNERQEAALSLLDRGAHRVYLQSEGVRSVGLPSAERGCVMFPYTPLISEYVFVWWDDAGRVTGWERVEPSSIDHPSLDTANYRFRDTEYRSAPQPRPGGGV